MLRDGLSNGIRVGSHLIKERVWQVKADRSVKGLHSFHRRTGNFLPGGAVNHLPKKFSQVAHIFTKQSSYDALT